MFNKTKSDVLLQQEGISVKASRIETSRRIWHQWPGLLDDHRSITPLVSLLTNKPMVEISQTNILLLHILHQTRLPSFSSQPALLHASERSLSSTRHSFVHSHDAILQRPRDAQTSSDVSRVDVGSQSRARIVRHVNRLLLGREAESTWEPSPSPTSAQ